MAFGLVKNGGGGRTGGGGYGWAMTKHHVGVMAFSPSGLSRVQTHDMKDPAPVPSAGLYEFSGVGSMGAVGVHAGHAYVYAGGGLGGNRLLVFSVSDEGALALVHTYSGASAINPADIKSQYLADQAGYLLMAMGNAAQLRVYDATNPAALALVGSLTNGTVLAGFESIMPSPDGQRVACVSHDAHTLAIVSLANPAAPAMLGSVVRAEITTGQTGFGVEWSLDGRYVFVLADAGLLIFEIVAGVPVYRTVYSSIGSSTGFDSVNACRRYGDRRLFCADYDNRRFVLLDISTPGAPVLTHALSIIPGYPFRVQVVEDQLYGLEFPGSGSDRTYALYGDVPIILGRLKVTHLDRFELVVEPPVIPAEVWTVAKVGGSENTYPGEDDAWSWSGPPDLRPGARYFAFVVTTSPDAPAQVPVVSGGGGTWTILDSEVKVFDAGSFGIRYGTFSVWEVTGLVETPDGFGGHLEIHVTVTPPAGINTWLVQIVGTDAAGTLGAIQAVPFSNVAALTIPDNVPASAQAAILGFTQHHNSFPVNDYGVGITPAADQVVDWLSAGDPPVGASLDVWAWGGDPGSDIVVTGQTPNDGLGNNFLKSAFLLHFEAP